MKNLATRWQQASRYAWDMAQVMSEDWAVIYWQNRASEFYRKARMHTNFEVVR